MDKTGKNTGPGKIREEVVRKDGIVIIGELFNYNFDGNLLKDEHKRWLDDKLVPFLKKFPTHVKLTGTASRKGDRDYNQKLSLERVLRVKDYLVKKGITEAQVPGTQMKAAGEDLSTPDRKEDDERDRAVQVTVAMGTKPRPIEVPPIVVTPKDDPIIMPPTIIIERRPRRKIPINVSQEWMIKQLSEGDLSVFKMIGVGGMFFQLVDMTNQEEVICFMAMGTLGGPGTPVSITLEGPENRFTTPQPQRITDFAGFNHWEFKFTVGPISKNRMVFNSIPESPGSTRRFVTNVDTGFTFGAATPGSGDGPMVCSDPRPFRP